MSAPQEFCQHCGGALPGPSAAELGGLELTRGVERDGAGGSVGYGVGGWVETPEGPAFVLDQRALDARRRERLREHAAARRAP